MNSATLSATRPDVQGLVQAVALNQTIDGLGLVLSTPNWELLGSYLVPCNLAQGQVLIEQGGGDRSLYFVESGSLSVHFEDSQGRIRLAIVGPGSAVGEGAFFSRLPRGATVQAASPSRLWCLAPTRFGELRNRHPELALEVVMALGSLVSRRLVNKPKRVAVT
ncbi:MULTISPECIES: cyclic nucleotide-binding domain-containing protein [Ramlibacter]|uniref:Cyclic nucleotide-binding domain-containing protein n=1 Tax=Ramlibacter aquaticus TaxID=2780094 RepID=A0ABR9SGJ5_9BURK|nr:MULTISPECIES: cyclic nucleotide-binding domain-containing protein [Ramlibacter]MBE7941014.1 cyclic nucleotide-binding domain-containing protein [Ramlibacter aquaticus]